MTGGDTWEEELDARYLEDIPEVDPEDLGIESFAGKSLEEIIEETDANPPPEKMDADWVARDKLVPNDWNPNYMPEHLEDALVLSILDNGWTAPILAQPDNTIVDGEHRWRIAGHEWIRNWDERKADWKNSLTPEGVPSNHVPVHYVDVEREQAMLATYQQNYARGEHDLRDMEQLVEDAFEEDNDEKLRTRMGVTEGELEQFRPDDELMDADADDEPWEVPWEDDEDTHRNDDELDRFADPLRFDMLESQAGEIRWLLAGDMTKIKDLIQFVEFHELDVDLKGEDAGGEYDV